MKTSHRVLFVALIASFAVVVCRPAAPARGEDKKDSKEAEQKRPEGSPDEKTVKEELKKQFATSQLNSKGDPYYEYKVEYKEIKYGTPYEGSWGHDGVPPNTKTMVYPVKTEMVVVRKGLTGNYPATTQKITVKSGFFRDSFGDWTYRNQDTQREDVK